jgi:hypothetical protein
MYNISLVDSSIHRYLGFSNLGLSAASLNIDWILIGALIPLWDPDFNSFG